jgi:hypothetical protein
VEIEPAVPRHELEHVIEKPDPGAHLVAAAAIERELHPNVGFRGAPINPRAPQ